mmetsp:Transcript_24939/g.27754  ORF Transcript_24939/g.27754 Transcript_24939/m.27754 type:complete len:180 (+) Transcript_24939:100-639(+)|eukprot:CAMPEP_0168510958 /NCGR_PEP_ID=MMETSP0405-20121227/1798_1 /TAXON_ID=498012 /ORGANISM="Trichosphaerium sp, Strain Am-I-7 wt" /LENGTH=179 /DNA_ID=CAMNT_0008528941 /DNA_START=62 /DNA_END=598 /DNA_ORIENTATION=-
MGQLFSMMWNKLFALKEFKVIIVGLNNAGKTTTLYKLLLDEVVLTTPTIGSNVEEIVYKNIKFNVWDIGGQESLRATWSTYYVDTSVMMMVVDSTDRERIGIVKAELAKMLSHEGLKHSLLLVLANKNDLKGAMSSAEVSDALGLNNVTTHQYHIQSCCALTGEGLFKAMDWVVSKSVK